MKRKMFYVIADSVHYSEDIIEVRATSDRSVHSYNADNAAI